MPHGREAVGWRVQVYWKTDMAFYAGTIAGYDLATGRHHVAYMDGDSEHLFLSNERVKWMLPPPGSAAAAAREQSAAAASTAMPLARPPASPALLPLSSSVAEILPLLSPGGTGALAHTQVPLSASSSATAEALHCMLSCPARNIPQQMRLS